MSMTKEELDKLYSPSQHSHRMSAEAVIEDHLRFLNETSKKIRSGNIPSLLGKHYGESDREIVDIYGTDLPDTAPVFVFIPGGYWQMLSGDICAYPAESMYKSGVVTIVVDYARAPGVTLTEIVGQVVKAMGWILKFATKERKSSSITLSGHSAGSHLAAMVLSSQWFLSLTESESSIFRSVYHLSGIFRLRGLLETYVNDPLGMTVDEADENSPLEIPNLHLLVENLKSKNPDFRTYVIAAEHESPIFVSQAEEYAKALTDAGLSNVVHRKLENVDHFNIGEQLVNEEYELTKLIKSNIV